MGAAQKSAGAWRGLPVKSLALVCAPAEQKAGQGECPVQSPVGARSKRLGRTTWKVKSSLWLLQGASVLCHPQSL